MPLLISQADVDAIVARKGAELRTKLIATVRDGFRELAVGSADMHPRIYLRSRTDPQRRPPGLFSMSALLGERGLMGTRLLALGGPGIGGDGLLALFDQHSLQCLAIINDQAVHRLRTGGPAGVAADVLARKDAKTIGVIGSGGIAEGGLTMTYHVRPAVTLVRVFSPTKANRERFASRMTGVLGVTVTAVDSAVAALDGADIVVTSTDADQPVVPDSAVAPGTHFNCMSRNELAPETFRRSRIFVSSTAMHEAHDPPYSPPLPHDRVAGDLIDLVAGKISGRQSAGEITVYAASGPMATWDVAVAAVVFEAATELHIGQEISL